jgi:uncharacterized protein YgiM (DUF1202 family)
MIEVFGKDGKVFRFQNGTSEEVIQAALDKHYAALEGATPEPPAAPPVPSPEPQAVAPAVAAPTPQPPPIAPPPAPTYAPPPIQAAQPAYQEPPPRYEDEYRPRENNALKFTMMAGAGALGILAVTGVLWATGMIGKKPEPTNSASASKAAVQESAFVATPQPDMRAAQVATQIRKEPKSESEVLKELTQGATVDVLGELTQGGVGWLRVRADQTGAIGYVIASHLGAFGSTPPPLEVQSTNQVQAPTNQVQSPVNGVQPPTVVPVPNVPIPAPPPPREVSVPQSTVYVASNQVNIRSAPDKDSRVVDRLDFGAAMTAFATNGTNGDWTKVRTSSGQVGWIKTSLVSQNPAVAPLDTPPPPVRQAAVLEKANDRYIARAPMGYYVQAGAARNKAEVDELIMRAQDAQSCTGTTPQAYASDAFVKTKTRGMALIAYGPFRSRDRAIAFREELRPCIGDAFITHQPY